LYHQGLQTSSCYPCQPETTAWSWNDDSHVTYGLKSPESIASVSGTDNVKPPTVEEAQLGDDFIPLNTFNENSDEDDDVEGEDDDDDGGDEEMDEET
jgi:hypothetical protein